MTEDDLHKLSLDELFDVMIRSSKELIEFNCGKDEIGYAEKKEEVQLIQKYIVAKRAEFRPLV